MKIVNKMEYGDAPLSITTCMSYLAAVIKTVQTVTLIHLSEGVWAANVRTVLSPGPRPTVWARTATRCSTLLWCSSSTPPNLSNLTKTASSTWLWEWRTESWRITSIFRGRSSQDLLTLTNIITGSSWFHSMTTDGRSTGMFSWR